MAKAKRECLAGLCKSEPTFVVYAQVGGKGKEVVVCDEHIQTIRNTVYVRPIDEAR